MATGRVIRFNQASGYGFIQPDDGSEDVFVHSNDLGEYAQIVRPGMRLAYNVLRGDRGHRACDVEIIAAPPASSPVRPEPVAAPVVPVQSAADDDGAFVDTVSATEYEREITDALIDTIGTVTASEIVEVRRRLVESAAKRGWLD